MTSSWLSVIFNLITDRRLHDMGNIPFRIDDEKHRKLKMRSFDYKMSMNDYLRVILDMSFEFSDEDFFEFVKSNNNGFNSLISTNEVIKTLARVLAQHENDSFKIQVILNDTESMMKLKLSNKLNNQCE